ncbi:MAG: cytochrome d ubiquinol oxidase subunit II [Gammaproteobacteria bacterium]|nr:cytochrome d ubiquinol oxidase subunit II [Gammaproteobacteria bacterium]
MDLTLIWAAIIALGVVVYVVLDGFVLGIAILFPFARTHADRDVMMNSVAPVWDGNQTWLVLGGAGLFAVFPAAYSILLPALYVPVLLMLIALVYRGVSFEFRFKSDRSRRLWDVSFSLGGFLAALCQGLILGTVVQGFEVQNGEYTGGPFDWLSPFTLLTGASVIIGYSLLGSTWLIMKTVGELQAWSYRIARFLLPVLVVCIGAVSIYTPLDQPAIAERWFSLPNFYYLSQVPLITFIVSVSCWYVLKRERQAQQSLPFYFSIGLFLLSYAGLVISIWPYIVPRAVTVWEAAAPPATQAFALIGYVVFLPLVIGYTVMAYRVFRGKVRHGEGYH